MVKPDSQKRTLRYDDNLDLLQEVGSEREAFLVLACEDNLKFMKRLPDDEVKLVVTSPPYNLGKEYETKTSLDDLP